MDLDEFNRLVGDIYEAPQKPGGWLVLLESIGSRIGTDGWSLMRFSRNDSTPEMLAVGGGRVSETSLSRYLSYYATIDPRTNVVRRTPEGGIYADHRIFDARFVSRSEFFQDFLIPCGVRYTAGGSPFQTDTHDYLFGFLRSPDRGPFQDAHDLLLQRLMPHLRRSLQLVDELQTHIGQAEMSSTALDTTPLAVISLDTAGRVRHCNTLAEKLLKAERILRVRAGILIPANAENERSFADALALCLCTGQPGTLMLAGKDMPSDRYSATLLKPPKSSGTGLLCLIAPLDRRRLPTARQLITLFNLTPAEARLTRAVASGESLEDYAQANGTKLSTVRTQLRSVFNKTGTDRQTALVRLILGVPAVRDP